MSEDMTVFSEETLLPVSLVIAALGGVAWLTKMFSMGRDNRDHLTSLMARVEMLEKESSSVCERLARIETKLDLLLSGKA